MDDIAKTYQPECFEQDIYARWEEAGCFAAGSTPGAEAFSIALPPPNVTGSLHMGHAFQQTLMDCLIRYHRMRGCNTLWQPGTDHAGIATQMVVERKLAAEEGLSRQALGREAFIGRIWQWKGESGGTITRQMRRLGASVDWARECFTMDEPLCAAVTEVFVRLYEEGLIYRGKRLVNWDPRLRTAISDLEVENREVQGSLWYIRYPLCGGRRTAAGHDYLLVATTRPETLPGDTAVAVNPADERYRDLIGGEAELPLCGRRIRIIGDEHADMTTGSGCVKITPAHDFNDYAVGRRHRLPLVSIMAEDGSLRQTAEVFDSEGQALPGFEALIPEACRGRDRFEARTLIVAALEGQGLLDHIEAHTLAQPFGDRGGVPIEPLLTDQWYVRAAALGEEAIRAVEDGRVRFVPAQYANMYFAWMRGLQDWCISRQLWWGHRIPAWYDEEGRVYVGRSAEEVRQRHSLGPELALRRDEDVLDTWFSSALWTFSTLGWPQDTPELRRFHPTSVLVTGFDIIFFWVARMLMMSLHFLRNPDGSPQVPFRTVYVTGLIRDELGQKMSKSKGNIIDPSDMIDGIGAEELVEKRTANMMQPQLAAAIAERTRRQFPQGIPAAGTDALRFTLCALASHGRDILWDMNRLEGYRNFCNKLWNAARFVLRNVQGHELRPTPEAEALLANRYIRAQLQAAAAAAEEALGAYRFDLLAAALYDFIWDRYCAVYLEYTKVILRGEGFSPAARDGTAYVLLDVLETALRLTHPVMPFITEALWQHCAPLLGRTHGQSTIMLCPWPAAAQLPSDPQALEEAAWLTELTGTIRSLRAELGLPPGQPLRAWLRHADARQAAAVTASAQLICAVAALERLELAEAGQELPQTVAKPLRRCEVLVETPARGAADTAAERRRLQEHEARLQAAVDRTRARLDNPEFLAKAPPHIIAGARTQLEDSCAQLQQVQAALARLPS